MAKFNYGLEKRKLIERRKKINKIMRLHGVKEEAIQELNEYDLNSLKKYRCYKRNENVTDSSFFDCQPCYDIIVQDVITKLSAHPDYDLFMEFINKYPQKRTIILMLNDSVSIKKIASFLHISESAVYKQIERMPYQFEKYKRRLNKK